MQIPVLIERIKGNGYQARGKDPFALSARGGTREEALTNLRTKIKARLSNGTEVVGLEIDPAPHPLAEFAGMFKDDPLFEDVIKIMAPSDDEPMVTKEMKTGLPVIERQQAAVPEEEMTPERVADILLAQEVEWHQTAGR